MAIAPLKKINLISLKANESQVLEILYDFGGLQIISNSQTSADAAVLDRLSQFEYQLAQVKFALNFINRYRPEEKLTWREKLVRLANQGLAASPAKVSQLLADFDYIEKIKQIEELEAELNSVNLKINQRQADIQELTPWQKLTASYHSDPTAKIQVRLGTLPREKFSELLADQNYPHQALAEIQVFEQAGTVGIAIIFLSTVGSVLSELLATYDFQEVVLPSYDDSPANLLTSYRQESAALVAKQEQLIKKAAAAVSFEEKFKISHDYLSWQRDKLSARVQAAESQAVFSLTAWIEQARWGELEQALAKVTTDFHLFELPLAADEEPPVLLKNKPWVQPFESVTNIYGAPKSFELDPTPYLAPFFILFFGICLSDAGYGLLLAGLAYGLIKFLKLPVYKQGMFRLLIYAGLVTFVVGVLFGGYFGLVLEDLPNGVIKTVLLQLRIIDPVKNPLVMLVFALLLGGLQIIAGLLINIYYQFRRRDWQKLIDGGVWLFFIFGIVFWLVAQQVLDSELLQTVGRYWIYAGAAVLVLTQGRRNRNLFLRLPLGALSLYNLVGYFSDIMSYSRLLALGLSTGIIAMVVNIVAFLFKDMIPWIGWPVAILILVGGHLFNLAINALGSFIHSGRLQYVEFFPKFMEGGGERFKPLMKTAKYIDLNKN